MNARFEVVRTDAPQPWHARFRASNGRILFSSEQYSRKGRAENAIESLAAAYINHRSDGSEIAWTPNHETRLAEVRYVDERQPHPGGSGAVSSDG